MADKEKWAESKLKLSCCLFGFFTLTILSYIYMDFLGPVLVFSGAWLFWSLRVHFQEEKEYKAKLSLYAQSGGKPYTNRKLCKTKAEEEAWDQQNEINRTARVIAGLGE